MHLLNDEDGDYGERNLFNNSGQREINTFNNQNGFNMSINNGLNPNQTPNNGMQNMTNYPNQNMGYNGQIQLQNQGVQPNQGNAQMDDDIYINGFNQNNGYSSGLNNRSNPSNYEYNNIEIRHNKVQVNKGALLFISIIFAYIGFIIIGISETGYMEDENGDSVAVVANLEDRDNREDFDKLKTHYAYLVNLLETSDTYENEMEKNLTPYFTLSTKYSDNLTLIDAYMTQVKALSLNEKYTSIQTQMYETYNYIAIYSQKMNTALLNDDLNSYQEAMTWKATSENSVENIRKNLIVFGETEAKIFNDKDLANSRLYNEDENDIVEDVDVTPTISTGHYGEETINPTVTPTNAPTNNLGGGRLDSTTQKENNVDNSNTEQNNDNSSETNDNDIVGIDNPYAN